jgi:hypothetical protein
LATDNTSNEEIGMRVGEEASWVSLNLLQAEASTFAVISQQRITSIIARSPPGVGKKKFAFARTSVGDIVSGFDTGCERSSQLGNQH